VCRARRVSSQCTPVLSCRRKMGRSVAAASEPRSRMHAAATCRGGTCGEGDAFGAWHGHIFPCKCLHVRCLASCSWAAYFALSTGYDASRHGEHAMRLCVLVGIAVLC